MVSLHEQISQCRYNEQAITVLHHAAIADLGNAKDALDDQKGMFWPVLSLIRTPYIVSNEGLPFKIAHVPVFLEEQNNN